MAKSTSQRLSLSDGALVQRNIDAPRPMASSATEFSDEGNKQTSEFVKTLKDVHGIRGERWTQWRGKRTGLRDQQLNVHESCVRITTADQTLLIGRSKDIQYAETCLRGSVQRCRSERACLQRLSFTGHSNRCHSSPICQQNNCTVRLSCLAVAVLII
jgi:hypothetical protein